MLLMIDNYDSFTYNLVQYLGELGEDVRVYRNDKITLQQIEDLRPDRIVISPGPCTPDEAGVSLAAIGRFAGRIPVLGVCGEWDHKFRRIMETYSGAIEFHNLPGGRDRPEIDPDKPFYWQRISPQEMQQLEDWGLL